MKIINLNTWGGKIHKSFFEFLDRNKDTDIFCFQEVFHKLPNNIDTDYFINHKEASRELFDEIKDRLKDHQAFFCPIHDENYGLAMFINKNLKVIDSGEILVYENKNYDPEDVNNDHGRKVQWIKIDTGLIIMNIHGHWVNNSKDDNLERLNQSQKIVNFLEKNIDCKKILCGDFNLHQNTTSIKMLENYLVNLVKEHNVTSTRTDFIDKSFDSAIDFIFISPDIKFKKFEILPDKISDHKPILIEF